MTENLLTPSASQAPSPVLQSRLRAGEGQANGGSKAAKLLGWEKVPATVINLYAIVKGEFAENAHRRVSCGSIDCACASAA